MDDFEWNVVNESQLLDAMAGHKPVGINKHFQMAFIWDKLTENIKKDVQSTRIWTHLETMYNLEVLDESESLPFPNEEREFNLPEAEFGALKLLKKDEKMEEKKIMPLKPIGGGRETPKLIGKEKEIVKKEVVEVVGKTPVRAIKEKEMVVRRDSKEKEIKEIVKVMPAKKEIKKEPEKVKIVKGRTPTQAVKEDLKKNKREESPRPVKRPTRGSIKPDDGNNGQKAASPLTVTPTAGKRRRL